MSSHRSRLSRESIAAAALAIADRDGFHAVSMRRVADEMKVGTMSLYYHVKTKDDLVGAMDDALMAEALLPALPKDWRRALMEIAKRTREVFVRHPWALVSMLSASPGVNAMRHMEQCLEALSVTKMTAKQKLTLLAMLDDFVLGHALREGAAQSEIDIEFGKAQLATGAFPRLQETFGRGRIDARANRFEQGVRAIIATFSD